MATILVVLVTVILIVWVRRRRWRVRQMEVGSLRRAAKWEPLNRQQKKALARTEVTPEQDRMTLGVREDLFVRLVGTVGESAPTCLGCSMTAQLIASAGWHPTGWEVVPLADTVSVTQHL